MRRYENYDCWWRTRVARSIDTLYGVGCDLVDWLHSHVQGLSDRREAKKYAAAMLHAGLIRHTVNKTTFSDQCYYTLGEMVTHGTTRELIYLTVGLGRFQFLKFPVLFGYSDKNAVFVWFRFWVTYLPKNLVFGRNSLIWRDIVISTKTLTPFRKLSCHKSSPVCVEMTQMTWPRSWKCPCELFWLVTYL